MPIYGFVALCRPEMFTFLRACGDGHFHPSLKYKMHQYSSCALTMHIIYIEGAHQLHAMVYEIGKQLN